MSLSNGVQRRLFTACIPDSAIQKSHEFSNGREENIPGGMSLAALAINLQTNGVGTVSICSSTRITHHGA